MSEHITYKRLLEICGEYSMLDCESDGNKRFAHRVLERMFYRGKHGSLVAICMCAQRGCITLPEEVELVEKAKINGVTQSLFSHWFEFANAREGDFHKRACGIQHLPNKFYTQYDSPLETFNLIVKSRNKQEGSEASITIHGRDSTGNKVYLRHSGKNETGEMLPLINEKFTAGTIPFSTITGIEKTKTKGYVDLFAKDPETGEMFYLSGYSPKETKPTYTRIKISGCEEDEKVRIDLLARLRILKDYECNELIPVVGLDVLETIAQEIRNQKDNDFQSAIAAGQMAKEQIRDENNYKYGNNVDALDLIDMGCSQSDEVW